MRRKVCVVVFSRANYGRIKYALKALKDNLEIDLQIIIGASALLWRYGNIIELMNNDGFAPDHKIYNVVEGETPITMAKSTGLFVVKSIIVPLILVCCAKSKCCKVKSIKKSINLYFIKKCLGKCI
jgi:hypothetical protein